MATSTEIKQRANALADKTDVNSITPKEVGGIMYDLASHGENVLRNGGTLGIRKVYESVAAMEADSTNPKDFWGDPIKKGNLVVIYDGTTTGVDNNKIYAFMKPGWQIATHLDAGYATKAGLDAAIENVLNSLRNSENALNESIDSLEETVTGNKKEVDEKLAELASEMLMLEQGGISTNGYDTTSTTRVRTLGYINGGRTINTEGNIIIWGCLAYDSSTFNFVKFSQIKKNKVTLEKGYVYRLTFAIGDGKSNISPQEIYGYTQGVSMANLYNENNRNAFESLLKANSILNSGWMDYDMVPNVGTSGYDGYVGTTAWDTLWVYILEGTKYIYIEGITHGSLRFFSEISTSTDYHLGANNTGEVIEGAKLCLISIKKSNNPNGYGNLKVRQYNGEYSKKEYVDKGLIKAGINIFIDKNHHFDINTGVYAKSSTHHSVWVNVDEGTEAIQLNEAVADWYAMFSSNTISSTTYLGGTTSGRISKAGSKIVIISLPIADNTDISDISVKLLGNKGDIPSSRNFVVAYRHLINIAADGKASYIKNNDYDCLWVHLMDNAKEIKVEGINATRAAYYKGSEISDENYLGTNNTGHVIKGATFCIINHKRKEEFVDYDKVTVVQKQDFVGNERFSNLFGEYIREIPTGKNYIDANNLLKGKILSGGQIINSANGIMSNKIYLEDGKKYTMQGIYYYGTSNKIYMATYDKKDNHIGLISVLAEFPEFDSTHMGKGTFKFNSNYGAISYVRIVLQGNSSYPFDASIAQLEEGETATEVVPYEGEERLFINSGNNNNNENPNARKVVRLLSIGNSYSEDSLSYVPYIMKNMGVNVDFQIGILMMSSSSLGHHIDNFTNQTDAYQFYLFDETNTWRRITYNASFPDSGNVSIQWALDNYKWDMIFPIGFGAGDYVGNMNTLINLVSSYVNYPIKWGVQVGYVRPSRANTWLDPTTTNYTEEEMTQRYEEQLDKSKNLMENTVCEIIVPIATAIKNACSVPSIKVLGEFSTFEGNNFPTINGVHPGYLAYMDGVHLQEGLPCQIAAYTFVRVLLDYYGHKELSIIGESTRVTSEWVNVKGIPHAHGEPIGSTDENCLVAQKSVVMAVKNPYQIIDMVEKGLV